MEQHILIQLITRDAGLGPRAVENTIKLLGEGATIPFISRYRKEATGGLDEVQIDQIATSMGRFLELEKRKATILTAIENQGKLTDELRKRIEASWDTTELEDIYLPYKQKRRTRAQVAREAGLEPLANIIQSQKGQPVHQIAQRYLCKDKGFETVDKVLQGAMDIVAERVSESERTRNAVRNLFRRGAMITSKVVKGKEQDGQKFRDYFDWSEPLSRCLSHRLLAMRRGEEEGILRVSIGIDNDFAIERIQGYFVHGNGEASELVAEAVADGYKRLLAPSIETEFAAASKQKADEDAIRIFVNNLEQLLMSSPLGQKRVLAIDPGFRTGCKVVCLSSEGALLHHEAIFPHPPRSERERASVSLKKLVERYKIEAISIGNGTAGRETEDFVRGLGLSPEIEIYVVSEDGASIYSASKQAREEFPDEDVTVRGAVSIGRRLMDPLAELVKIDPSSIGVGQYQKDVNQGELKRSLDQTVVSCVNRVGVNLNTASKYLLTYVSGLGPALAQNIVNYRDENGAFTSRKELMKVPRMGAKAFEQCVGFLRVQNDKQPLDNSAVHPERYALVERMAKDLGCKVSDLMQDRNLRQKIDVQRYVTEEVGLPTLNDILAELDKPGRDPRTPLKAFAFDPTVHEPSDLRPGMVLPGIVSNVTNFGVFVDVGVHTKGLVHVSQLCNRFVKDPLEVVSLHQQVMVRVISVDLERDRISLSMRDV